MTPTPDFDDYVSMQRQDPGEQFLEQLQEKSGLSDYTAQGILNYLTGQLMPPYQTAGTQTNTVTPNPPIGVWLALFTAAPTSDAGTGGTEVSGGSYARVQIAGSLAASSAATTVITFSSVPAWIVPGMSVRDVTTPSKVPSNTTVVSTTATTVTCNNTVSTVGTDTIVFSAFLPPTASSGNEPATTPAFATNTSAAITFPQSTASWGTVVAWGLYDASTSGNLIWWDYLGNFKWLPFSASNASPSVLTSPAHGFSNSDPVVVTAKYGGTLPATGGSWSGILTVANSTTDTFTAGVNTTGTGDGQVRKIVQQSIPINITASFAAGAMILSLA